MYVKQYKSKNIICGCDEAGRGALAGPVIASAVVLPKNFSHKKLNDSKKLSEQSRNEMADFIKNKSLFWSIGIANVSKIDKLNILNASIYAMHDAINKIITKMTHPPELLLIDGNRFKAYKNIKHKCIIKGDAKYCSIAAASIIAKTYRDQLMIKLDQDYPHYNWKKNKGYPTKEHKKQICKLGSTKHHRTSFKLFETQYTLPF